MFLFDKPFTVKQKPFSYFTIENALDSNLADWLAEEYNLGMAGKSDVWFQFINFHISKLTKIADIFDDAFGLSNCDVDYETHFRQHPPNQSKLIRDWHTDGPSKKYQIIYYLGNAEPTASIQLAESQNGSSTINIPFQHNRVLVFHVEQNKSWHRYFGSDKVSRNTWNMPVVYKL